MLSSEPGSRARTRIAGLAIAALALSGCTAGGAGGGEGSPGPETVSGAAGTPAVVVRVIDGDTFEASVDGEDKTIRLLNVDTPETKDPNAPVECLGPEASKNLEELLPAGSRVRLELDVEPLDKYGRTLAGVFDSGGRLVNAEVARLGFGVPVLIEPNRKFHPLVVEAFDEARARGAGLASADIPCLPAHQVEQAVQAVEALAAAPLPGSLPQLDQADTALAAALATVAALRTAANARNGVAWAAYEPARLAKQGSRLDTAASAGSARLAAIGAKKKDLADTAEAARKAAEAAAAEAERIRNLPPAPAPYVPPAYIPPAAPPAPAPPAYVPPPAPANPYPGYTGPRCYAPGGKSWKPC